jgi:hypothetical protein
MSDKKVALKIRSLSASVLPLLLPFLFGLSGCPSPLCQGAPGLPGITIADATYRTSSLVTISAGEGEDLFYSLDCSTPERLYTGPIPVYGPLSITVKAMARTGGSQSDIAARTFPSIRPFNFGATVDPAPRRMNCFNDLCIAAWWDTANRLHFIFTTNSTLDDRTWSCTLDGGLHVVTAKASHGSAVFSWPTSASIPPMATAKVTAGTSPRAGDNTYFEVISSFVPRDIDDDDPPGHHGHRHGHRGNGSGDGNDDGNGHGNGGGNSGGNGHDNQ